MTLSNTKPKLLVVDDEPDNLDLLYRTFYREYKVFRAESGPDALELLTKEGNIAVIITDQRMPVMSGTELLSITAEQYPDMIRIMLTGYTDVEDLVEAINSGKVFKYVTKPWDAQELKAIVRQALETFNLVQFRTQELSRSLRRESLLNTVTNTIRNAQYVSSDISPLKQILQTIVDTVGQMLEASVCILRPYNDQQLATKYFIYHQENIAETSLSNINQTVWPIDQVTVINDVATDSNFQADQPQNKLLPVYQQANINSSLIVPLIAQQQVRAVMALHQCGEQRIWTEDEIQLLSMVADQAALAISQAHAYEQVRDLAQRELLVNTITTAIRSSLDPQDIFAAITEQLGQALKVDGCTLSLWTENDEYVQCVGLYEAQHSESAAKQDLPQSLVPIVGNPVLQQLMLTQQPVYLDDLSEQPQMQGFDLPLRSPARALLLVPLLSDGKIIGSITLRQSTKPRKWREADVELAQTVAAQAAIAVQQSRLYQKTKQQTEKLLELDRQKTEFFQNISHEFRTPLTLMIGPLESAINNQQSLAYEQAEIALRNSRRLLRLVNQLLDIQRLDAGKMQASFRPTNLAEFVNQIVGNFSPYCQKKGINLVANIIPIPSIYLDAEKFDKVLYNLLSNAMKFTPSGGTITINVQPAGDHVRMQVTDTGIGIKSTQLLHVFERFRQAEGSVNRSYEGSGLGLALVKELVELHGGKISVESEYEKGTTFTIWLQTGIDHLPGEQVLEVPVEIQSTRAAIELADIEIEADDLTLKTAGENQNKLPEESTINNTQSPFPNAQILFTDDNPDLRSYVGGILRQAGYKVLLARNGQEGYEMVEAHKPNLIITDLMMPEVSGLDLIRMLRSNDQLKGTPIILLTAKADEETRIDGVERGADAYLAKPFNERELLAGVRNLLALKENEQRVTELNTYLTQSVLSRFLPPKLVEQCAKGQLSLDLRPEPRLVTILFSDIVGFTQLSNTLRSRKVAEILNEYLESMSKAVFDNGGTVDKFIGDAILALFGAPEELTPNEQVKRAVSTARQMLINLEKLNQKWTEQGIVGSEGRNLVQFRCGIHQGTAVVGMFGSKERADYTAIGPAVNIASRLQQATTPNSILVSAAVADYLDEEEITKFSSLQLKGIDETVLTFIVNPRQI
jgi:signal transduction histidine kinase/DNA-binding response OmpR family regulator